MAKNGKIGIRMFANESLKSHSIVWKGEISPAYPLYCVVTYRRDNAKFRVLIDGQTVMVTPDLDQVTSDPHLSKKVADYKNHIETIIRVADEKERDFSIKGINQRLYYYSMPVTTCLLETKLKRYLEIVETTGEAKLHSGLLETVFVINQQFKSMTVLDWYQGGSSQVRKHLRANTEISPDTIKVLDEILAYDEESTSILGPL
ncbi:hypothetical protein [Phaeodactylibacter xiamenensis]|uniref:hypothetical protein n=1 Tax=Phaeodactylibacter xiamenensis TaxID=1524460 RepID=UPI0024A7C96E|nr:hypothetical protein [Phaeodactylibacter xiamenensis]